MKVYRERKVAPTYSKGTYVELDGNELAHAIDVYLYAVGVTVHGPRTIRILTKGGALELCSGASVYVDPTGRVIHEGEEV